MSLSSSSSFKSRKKAQSTALFSDLLSPLDEKSHRPGTPPPELTTIQAYSEKGNQTETRPLSTVSTSSTSSSLTSSSTRVKKRPSTSKSHHPLEVAAVASATKHVKNPSSRSICSRYSINASRSRTHKDDGKNLQRSFSAQNQSTSHKKENQANYEVSSSPFFLPPIVPGECSNKEEYEEYNKYVLKETLFSKVVYKVKKGEYHELPYELLHGFLYTTDLPNYHWEQPSVLNYLTSSGFYKASKAPTLPVIPETKAVNHVSLPLLCTECHLVSNSDNNGGGGVQWTDEGRLYFSN